MQIVRKTLSVFIILVLLPACLFAKIYKAVDGKGNVSFSDQPSPTSNAVRISEPSSLSWRSQEKAKVVEKDKPKDEKVSPEKSVSYTSLNITYPSAEQTIRNTAGLVTVTVSVTPALQPKHKFRVILDAASFSGRYSITSFSLSNVSRGAHNMRVQVLDAHDRVLKTSASVQFFVHQHFKK